MDTIITTDNIKILISILSLMFAVWQYSQKRKIKKLIALEAIELHKNISKALGATQAAKIAIATKQPPSAEIGRAEGICQAILYESAKLYCNLKDTKLDDIDDLISNGQLNEMYKDIYYSFSDSRRGSLRKITKWILKIF
ncbi:MAG: hypothetical protein JZU53_06545 [Paludibacter sp.]|nr:hypothetical protein [Paludibacter sp.]